MEPLLRRFHLDCCARSLPCPSSIEAEAGVWLVHNPEDLRPHAFKKEYASCHRSTFIKLLPTRLWPCWKPALSRGVPRSLAAVRPGTVLLLPRSSIGSSRAPVTKDLFI